MRLATIKADELFLSLPSVKARNAKSRQIVLGSTPKPVAAQSLSVDQHLNQMHPMPFGK